MKILIENRHESLAKKCLVVFLLAMVLLPVSPAHAQISGGGTDTSILSCAASPIDCTLNFVRSFLVNLIAFVGSGVDYALKLDTANEVVTSSWEIVRGFANMFFILALIIMAFATIFSVGGLQKYNFSSLIARFLIAVLLINFSLVIGELIIDWSQSLSNVFLDAIGDVGARIAQGANIAKNLDAGTIVSAPIDQVSWGETMKAGVNIIMLAIIFFSLLVLLVFAVIRVPILWALLIVSPIAWITYILPTTMDVNRKWWRYFIGWNVFMPIYLFFIYFGVLFLNNQDRVLANLESAKLGTLDYSFQFIFFYVLIALFLIWGAKYAMTSSMAAGAGGVAGAIWARGRATARWAGAMPYRVGKYGVGVGWKASGAQEAYKEAKEHIQKEGFVGTPLENIPIIGGYRGQRGREDRAARIAGWAGVPGVREKQFARNVSGYQERYKNITDVARLRGFAAAGPIEQQFAARQRLNDLGEMRPIEGLDTYELLRNSGYMIEARKQAQQIDYGNLSRTEREQAYNRVADVDIRRKIQNTRQKKGDFITADSMRQAATLFTPGSEEQIEFYRTGKSVIADNFTQTERNDLYTDAGLNPEIRRMVAETMIDKGEIRGPELDNALNLMPGRNAPAASDEHRAFTSEANRLLEKARKHDLVTAVQIQTRLGLIVDKNSPTQTPFTPTQVGDALRQEIGNLSVSKILELPDSVLNSTEFQTTVIPTLNLQKIEKLLSDASENQRRIIEPVIGARRTELSNVELSRRAQPFISALRRLQTLTGQIRAASTPTDKQALIQMAKESLDRSGKLVAEIEDIRFADQALKNNARQNFDSITGDYYRAIQ